jgi:hypothetical protein
MKLFDADFLPKNRPPLWLWLIPAGAACAVVALAVLSAQERAAAQKALVQAHDQRAASLAAEHQASATVTRTPYYEFAMEFLAERSGLWPVLTSIESMNCPQAQPVVLSYTARPRGATLELEFTDQSALTSCIKQLNAGLDMGKEGWWDISEIRVTDGKSTARLMLQGVGR